VHGHLALHHDGDPVADHFQFTEEVTVEEYGSPLVAELQEQITDFASSDGIDAVSWLIKNDDLGIIHHGLSEADPLEHAFGVGLESTGGPSRHADAAKQSIGIGATFVFEHARQRAAELDDLASREVLRKVVVLWKVAHMLEGGLVADGVAEKGATDLAWSDDSHEDFDERRFSGAIGSEQAEDFAWGNVKIDATQCLDPLFEGLVDVPDVDDMLMVDHCYRLLESEFGGNSCAAVSSTSFWLSGYPSHVPKSVFPDLGSLLRHLDEVGELVRVTREVSPILEITEVADRHSKSSCALKSAAASRFDPSHADFGGKALLFEQVEGCDFPLAINVFGSYARMELALGCHDAGGFEAIGATLGSLAQPKPPRGLGEAIALGREYLPLLRSTPKLRKRGACQDVVLRADRGEVHCSRLPILKCWPHDGDPEAVGIAMTPDASGTAGGDGRFITFGGVHTIHASDRNEARPASHNIGMYRVQLVDDTHLVMHWHLHHDGAAHWRSWKELGEPMPVAICFGGESVLPYAATAPMPPGLSELLLAGFLNGGGIPLVAAKTVPLRVPANSEIVIEGLVRTDAGGIGWDPDGDEPLGPGAAFEGPFGDHTGFYSMPDRYPLMDVTAITHRRNAVMPATVVGVPPQEDYAIGKATERIFLPLLQTLIPDIIDYHLPMFGSFHQCVFVQIRKSYPLHARRVMHAIWGAGQMAWTKMIIVVDEDVDVHDSCAVMEAIAKHAEFPRDLECVHGPLDILDHSAPRLAGGGKMGIDATVSIPGEEVGGIPIGSPPGADVASVSRSVEGLQGTAGIEQLHVPAWGHGRVVVLAVAGRPDGAAGKAIEAVFECAGEGAELIIAVDADIDPAEMERSLFMVCANFDWTRDLHERDHRIGFDGTSKSTSHERHGQPCRAWPPRIEMDQAIRDQVESNKAAFGLK
jgi:4-hydroxy-3-polyprenylbenzoate decarboxylase